MVASAGLLIFLYLIVLVPNFFSTQDPERTDARQAFIPVQMVHFFDDGTLSPWVPAIVGKRNPTTLRMEWVTDPQKKVPVRFFAPGFSCARTRVDNNASSTAITIRDNRIRTASLASGTSHALVQRSKSVLDGMQTTLAV